MKKENTRHVQNHVNPLSSDKSLYDTPDVSIVFGTKPETIEQWRLKGVGPKFIRLPGSRLIRYRRQDLLDYIANLTAVSSTTEADQVQGAS